MASLLLVLPCLWALDAKHGHRHRSRQFPRAVSTVPTPATFKVRPIFADDDVNDLEAPGRPPTPPWRARAPARNMSVAGVSGIN